MMDLIFALPEIKACTWCDGVSVYKEPDETHSSYYWFKTTAEYDFNMLPEYNFLIDTLTYEIKYYDPETNVQLTLSEWRKKRK